MVIQNESSMPVRKRPKSTTSPINPAVTSLIGALLTNILQEISDEGKALEKTAQAQTERNRVVGNPETRADFLCPDKVKAVKNEIVANESKQNDPHASRNDLHDTLIFWAQLYREKVHID